MKIIKKGRSKGQKRDAFMHMRFVLNRKNA